MNTNRNGRANDRPPTWERLAELEPGLQSLLNEARSIRDDGAASGFCASDIWIRCLKPRLRRLAGFDREPSDRVLSTAYAYEIALNKLLDALPPCRNCGCLRR
jgi:hypothetical protein